MEGGLDSLFLTEYEQYGWEQTDPALWESEALVGNRIPVLPSPPKLSLNLEAFGIPETNFPMLPLPLYTSTADSSHISAGDALEAEGATSALASTRTEGIGRSKTCKKTENCKKTDDLEAPVEPKDQKKKIRRRLSNRESARRSRARRQSQLDTLEVQVAELRVSNAALLKKAQDAAQRLAEHSKSNDAMREEIAMLRRTLDEWTNHEETVADKEVESVHVKEEP